MSLRRRSRRSQVHHGDDWLITYADTITLLLCLFVVLVASQAKKPGRTQDPMPAILAEQPSAPARFVDPTPVFQPISPDDAHAGTEDAITPPPEEDSAPPPLLASIPQPAPTPQHPSFAPPTLQSEAAPVPEPAANPAPKGDRITTLEFDSAAFFSRGAATLNNSGKVILQDVVGNLRSEEYRDYMITIEGHTDDAPISTPQFPSNWELSAARAAAVVRFFVEQGVPAQRLRAAGYADTHPVQPNRDGNGMALPENQARNRRVVIGLEKIEHRLP